MHTPTLGLYPTLEANSSHDRAGLRPLSSKSTEAGYDTID
jgi:hypothetical protein